MLGHEAIKNPRKAINKGYPGILQLFVLKAFRLILNSFV